MAEGEVLLSGIGGQGVQLAAKTLALAALGEGRPSMMTSEVSGAMRGGHSMATVVVGDGRLAGLPVVSEVGSAIVFHPMALEDVIRRLRPGATMLVNSTLVDPESLASANGAVIWRMPATELCTRVGSVQALGFVMLGAFASLTGIVAVPSLVSAMTEMLPPYRQQHVEGNRRAIEFGAAQMTLGPAENSATAVVGC